MIARIQFTLAMVEILADYKQILQGHFQGK